MNNLYRLSNVLVFLTIIFASGFAIYQQTTDAGVIPLSILVASFFASIFIVGYSTLETRKY